MRTASLKFLGLLALVFGLAFALPQRAAADDDDPPSRVARLSQIKGSVSFNPAGTDDWVDAVPNRPMTTGDKLWSDSNSRAELHLGSASLRISGNTGFSFLNLTDDTTQLQVTEGTLRVRIKRLGENETFEIDTPNLAFSILRPGVYKVNVNQGGDVTLVEVLEGQGEITGGGTAYNIRAGETGTFSGLDQLSAEIDRSRYDDDRDFDRWCADRDRHEDRSVSSRYVSDDVIGYDDLDDYGGWRTVPEYGGVWFPHVTVVDWAPYRYGHWVWISPWGWTWVDDAPWGFAPFHYGRWVVVGGVWGWVPGPRPVVGVAYVRPVYAPALVAWVGGPHFSVGIGVGSGPVGWFPLGPREVYVPSYRVSERYVTRVNVTNTTVNTTVVNNYYNNVVVNKNVNVTNVTYVNRAAVTATSNNVFTSAQPVGRNIVKVDQREVERATVVATTPAVAPQQRSVLGAGAQARVVPPAAVQQRVVVAKTPPPPPPAPFQRQSEMIRANGGRPVSMTETRQATVQNQNTQNVRTNVRIAPPARQMPQQQNPPANRPVIAPNEAPQPVGKPSQVSPRDKPRDNARDSQPDNPRQYRDRPPTSRPVNPNPPANPPANPQLDQKQQQQVEQLRQKQDQERQRVEQQQRQQQQKLDQERQRIEQQQQQQQKLDQQRANEEKQRQAQQHQQQQLENLERKHDQEQQKLQQRQQQERAHQENRPPKQEKDKQDKKDKDKPKDKPPR